jgi:hypothetical protein
VLSFSEITPFKPRSTLPGLLLFATSPILSRLDGSAPASSANTLISAAVLELMKPGVAIRRASSFWNIESANRLSADQQGTSLLRWLGSAFTSGGCGALDRGSPGRHRSRGFCFLNIDDRTRLVVASLPSAGLVRPDAPPVSGKCGQGASVGIATAWSGLFS